MLHVGAIKLEQFGFAKLTMEDFPFRKLRRVADSLGEMLQDDKAVPMSVVGWARIRDVIKQFNSDNDNTASGEEGIQIDLPRLLHTARHTRKPAFEILGVAFSPKGNPNPSWPFVCIEPLMIRVYEGAKYLSEDYGKFTWPNPAAYSAGNPHCWLMPDEFRMSGEGDNTSILTAGVSDVDFGRIISTGAIVLQGPDQNVPTAPEDIVDMGYGDIEINN